jgi:hypothetical protein
MGLPQTMAMDSHTRESAISAGLVKVCIAVFLLAQPYTTLAAGLGFLKNSAAGYFDQEDIELMIGNASRVLEATDPHATRDWSNPKSGNFGRAEVLRVFTGLDGVLCKQVRVSNNVTRGDIEDQATYTVCKYFDRGWLLSGLVSLK